MVCKSSVWNKPANTLVAVPVCGTALAALVGRVANDDERYHDHRAVQMAAQVVDARIVERDREVLIDIVAHRGRTVRHQARHGFAVVAVILRDEMHRVARRDTQQRRFQYE